MDGGMIWSNGGCDIRVESALDMWAGYIEGCYKALSVQCVGGGYVTVRMGQHTFHCLLGRKGLRDVMVIVMAVVA